MNKNKLYKISLGLYPRNRVVWLHDPTFDSFVRARQVIQRILLNEMEQLKPTWPQLQEMAQVLVSALTITPRVPEGALHS